jgi:hypothetical protein
MKAIAKTMGTRHVTQASAATSTSTRLLAPADTPWG